tara:strand:- start:3419 stop:3961 length:543 start_codon:yes stop_codon:yes gene_type:complete
MMLYAEWFVYILTAVLVIFTLLPQSKVRFGAIRGMAFLRLQVVCIAGGRAVEDYAYWVKVPKDNGYGICVMSRLALSDITVREVGTEGVPSVRAGVTLRSGARLRLYVIHPEPPVIHHDTKGRDSEIAHVGMEAARDPLPAIVTGDLNDVAWSSTTRSFQRLSGLLAPWIGTVAAGLFVS